MTALLAAGSAVVLALLLLLAAGWAAARRASPETRELMRRIGRLPWRAKLRLGLALARDRRIPLAVRAIPVVLALYLAMPLDIVPDFIPVLGQLDDIAIVAIGVALLLRLAPRNVVEEHAGRLGRHYPKEEHAPHG